MIKSIILEIVNEAVLELEGKVDDPLVIDFVDIFPQSNEELVSLLFEANKLGVKVDETKTGEIYRLNTPIKTKYGLLSLVKIRILDSSRNQRGAPDFKVKNYVEFKKVHKDFNLIVRPGYELLELRGDRVLIYFPSETLSESLDN